MPVADALADALPRSGERVTLRRLRADDLDAFQAYRHDPVVGRYQGWSAMTHAASAAFISAMSVAPLIRGGEWVQIGIAERGTDRLIGDMGLHQAADGAVEIGFTLEAAAQGRGLATEAVSAAIALLFDHADAPRIIGITDARNLPSMRLLERLGMQPVRTTLGIFRGEPCTEHVYAIERP